MLEVDHLGSKKSLDSSPKLYRIDLWLQDAGIGRCFSRSSAFGNSVQKSPQTEPADSSYCPVRIIDKDYNVLKKKSKYYYSLLLCKKAQFPNRSLTLKREFDSRWPTTESIYSTRNTVWCEPYIKAFQYKVLNCIVYTNTKLNKIGFATEDTCSFCKSHPETLIHLFFDCIYWGSASMLLSEVIFKLIET